MLSRSPLGDRSGRPMVAGQWRDLDAVDYPASKGRIEIAHRLLIEVDDTAGREWPDIIDLDNDPLTSALNESVVGPPGMAYPAEPSAQIGLDRRGPRGRIVALAGGCSCAAFLISGLEGIVHGRRADNRGGTGNNPPRRVRLGSGHGSRRTRKYKCGAANRGAQAHHHSETP